MKIIFLDVDGVLNNRYTLDRTPTGYTGVDDKNLQQLKKLVEATSAKIVLSSDWRLDFGADMKPGEDAQYLINRLANYDLKIFDMTMNAGSYHCRGFEISQYLKNHSRSIDTYVILDDINFTDFTVYDLQNNFVKTNYYYGLQAAETNKAIQILSGNFSNLEAEL